MKIIHLHFIIIKQLYYVISDEILYNLIHIRNVILNPPDESNYFIFYKINKYDAFSV
jgi:hypothetical protein